jgi:hypothetical protein
MYMKDSNDTTGNRTRDLPACSAVTQPTALPRGALCVYLVTAQRDASVEVDTRKMFIEGVSFQGVSFQKPIFDSQQL